VLEKDGVDQLTCEQWRSIT